MSAPSPRSSTFAAALAALVSVVTFHPHRAIAQAASTSTCTEQGAPCSAVLHGRTFTGLCTTIPDGTLTCLPPSPASQCSRCGDGVVNTGEQCDPGSARFTSTCNNDCTVSVCGDGIVNPAAGEQCDPGAPGLSTQTCNANCTVARCGDGIVNHAAGEQCDDGGETATCTALCRTSTCGDGYVNRAAGEECDLGPLNGATGSTCGFNCQLVR